MNGANQRRRAGEGAYVLALDQGTTSSRAMLFDLERADRGPIGVAQRPIQQCFPEPGWVEHDPEEIWATQLQVAREALQRAGVTARQLIALGITNQRETTIVWERATGKPVHRAIVWQDRRTAAFCEELARKEPATAELVRARTGLLLDPYFSGTKLRWLFDHVADLRRRAARGELCFGTVDSWLIYKLTGGRVHATDVSNASRTLLLNIHTLEWDTELLELLGIPEAANMLPAVQPSASASAYGATEDELFGYPVPITGVAGDQQAALFGQDCLEPGMAKNTYGTGCFLLMNAGRQPPAGLLSGPAASSGKSPAGGLLATVGWQLPGEGPVYALEGSVFIGGAVVQWLRDGLGIIERSDQVEALARSVPDNGGVYFVPALTGLGAPHWDPYARGMIIGITRGTSRGHIARAALEAIAYQVRDVLRAMENASGIPVRELRADGGAAVNDLLMQFQADILGRPVLRPRMTELTALGAARLAGIGAGLAPGARAGAMANAAPAAGGTGPAEAAPAAGGVGPTDAAPAAGGVGPAEAVARDSVGQLPYRRFEPLMDEEERVRLCSEWDRAVRRALHWAGP